MINSKSQREILFMKQSEIGSNDKRPRSILEEIKGVSPIKVKEHVISSRANHIIQSAINMLQKLDEVYDTDTSEMLKRRFIVSIKTSDPDKFARAVERASKE